MVKVIFIQSDGLARSIDVEVGHTLMEAAMQNGVRGLLAECGGACTCATCHVYVDPRWALVIKPPNPLEIDMLSFVVEPNECSRLACQITIERELDGLVARLPMSQV